MANNEQEDYRAEQGIAEYWRGEKQNTVHGDLRIFGMILEKDEPPETIL
jgi:hypothetical protein